MNTLVSTFTESWAGRALHVATFAREQLNKLAPLSSLALRLWVADAFFKSGLTKIQSWDTTLLLFQYEYQVPLLPPALAAVAGTATELGMPVLLALGLAGRLSAGVLFIFNIIAVISYPALEAAGREMHLAWGVALLVLLAQGPGKLALDRLVERFISARA